MSVNYKAIIEDKILQLEHEAEKYRKEFECMDLVDIDRGTVWISYISAKSAIKSLQSVLDDAEV